MADTISTNCKPDVVTVEVNPVTITTTTNPVQVVGIVANPVTVTQSVTPVTITTACQQGPQGPQGPPGPGGSGSTYIFDQGTPATTWNVVHNLNKFQSVTVVDSAGTVVVGTTDYIDSNSLVLTFTVPFGGKCFLN